MTDRELLQQALEVLTSVAITKRSVVTDNGSAVLPFEVLIKCADMVSAIGTRLAQPEPEPVAWYYAETPVECEKVALDSELDEKQKANCIPLYTAPQKKKLVGFIGVMDIAQSSLQLIFKTREQANEVKAELEGNNT